jgi:16S rRNA (guanine966-N2)-methyltransferase
MRVIAGKYRSRPLRSLRGMDLRPTADRLRETLFDVLTAGNPAALEGTVWLDLFAGTGAVGIEALSRGASSVYFVESSVPVTELVRKNLQSLGVESGFQVLNQDVVRTLQKLEAEPVTADFVFLDPPYRMEGTYQRTLGFLGESRLLSSNGIVMAEHQKKFDPGEIFGSLRRYRKLEQGDATLSFYRKM